jgi:hypothetical protein
MRLLSRKPAARHQALDQGVLGGGELLLVEAAGLASGFDLE